MSKRGSKFAFGGGAAKLRALCSAFFGIPSVRLFQADGLDLPGADVDGLLARAKASWDS